MEMEQTSPFLATKRYAVVTGANKGIGFEICRQLASNGIVVVLTSRDEKRGLEAVQKLKESEPGLSDYVIFHQLDVGNPASVASLADFITTQFEKLDILVNNAGIGGATLNADAFVRATELSGGWPQGEHANWNELASQTSEAAEEGLNTNYYGAKRMFEGLVPLLQLSDSPRIVNVSSLLGLLKNIPNEGTKEVLNDVESLTEERIDEVLNKFLKDLKEGSLEKEGWPTYLSAYILSKASMNAYTRILAKKYPAFLVNCVCPGFVKTDITCNTGLFNAAEGAQSPVRLALLPHAGPSGLFYSRDQLSCF
ncbi:(+)-neomenthol dehydrogenase-like [Pistacia vera]|uniref:(+)-neomenthol dehydrogenase-like n=1 Tax=Pistacia vera TaxID=55513 RepID=UPI001262C584|nr:(+)-neomenthol dehydrogenase-like [Pistacia vera]